MWTEYLKNDCIQFPQGGELNSGRFRGRGNNNLPEIKNLITRFNIGCVIDNHEPKHIAEKINFMLSSPDYNTWKDNTQKAASENTWENEKQNLEKLLQTVNWI